MEGKVKEFIKLPNSLVWDISGRRENTYSYEFTEKICHIWSMFDCLLNRIGAISFSIEQLITVLGTKPDTHTGRNVEQFRSVLLGLEEKKYIVNVSCDLNLVKHKELITCEYSIPMLVDEEGKDTQFFMVYREDYFKLLNCETNLTKTRLIYVYYYLLSRMKNGKSDTIRYCFPSYDDIKKSSGISKTTFNTCLNVLKELELIDYGNVGVIIKNGEKKQANNVYVRNKSHLQDALDISKNYWSAEGWMVVGKKVTKINATIKGLKGQIQKQQNAGKDTTRLENRLTKLKEKVTNKVDKSLNDVKREIQALNENMNSLGCIYNLETNIFAKWEDYFSELGKDMYNIDDCIEVLDYMKKLHKA